MVYPEQFCYAEKPVNTCAHNARACVRAGVIPTLLHGPTLGNFVCMANW
jgi:hypothetical protein